MLTNWEGIEEVVAVAHAGSFKGGAALLNISTSHVSRMVARIEKRLGAQIFHRTTRSVRLTNVGRAFVAGSERLIGDREKLLSLTTAAEEPQGELRITCSTTLGERFVAPITQRFAAHHPRLSITLDLTNRVVDILGEGYDLGIRTGQRSDHRLSSEQIASRHLETCASPAYLSANGTPTTIADLRDHHCLIGTNPVWHFEDAGSRAFVPQGRWRCNSGHAVVAATLTGAGVCQLPSFYVRDHLSNGSLHTVLDQYRCNPEPIWAVYPERHQILPKISKLVEILKTDLACMLQGGMKPFPESAT